MNLSLERVTLFVSLLIFLGFGSWLFIAPQALEPLGIQLLEPAARIDVRATYGGMELGLAAFLLLCLLRDAWVRVGLTAAGCVIAGFGCARLAAIALEGQGTPLMWRFVAIELASTLLILWVLKRRPAEG